MAMVRNKYRTGDDSLRYKIQLKKDADGDTEIIDTDYKNYQEGDLIYWKGFTYEVVGNLICECDTIGREKITIAIIKYDISTPALVLGKMFEEAGFYDNA